MKPLPLKKKLSVKKKHVTCKACGDSGINSKGGPCYACQGRRWNKR